VNIDSNDGFNKKKPAVMGDGRLWFGPQEAAVLGRNAY
jgi:hypothetical protein